MPISYGNLGGSGLSSRRRRLLVDTPNNATVKVADVVKNITVCNIGTSESFSKPVKDVFSKKIEEKKSKTKDAYISKVSKLRF